MSNMPSVVKICEEKCRHECKKAQTCHFVGIFVIFAFQKKLRNY